MWACPGVSALLMTTGCSSSIAGWAHPDHSPEAKQVETGIALQNLTTAPAKVMTYAGQSGYDACAIMNLFLMQQAGFMINREKTFTQKKFTVLTVHRPLALSRTIRPGSTSHWNPHPSG